MPSFHVARLVRKIFAVFASVLLLVLCYGLWAYRKYELQREANARIAESLDATYRSRLAQFQNDLPLKTSRSEVEKYLTSKDIFFTKWRVLIVALGDEPGDGLICGSWRAYAYFEFTPADAQSDQSPDDALKAITFKRIGRCL